MARSLPLLDVREEAGVACLLVSHPLPVVRCMSHRGEITETGGADAIAKTG